MRYLIICVFLSIIVIKTYSQVPAEYSNATFLKRLNKDSSYIQLKKKIITEYSDAGAGKWGERVKGVITSFTSDRKYVAFTFDGCGGRNGNGYDKELIDFLHKEKVPATLFISGKWIDANFDIFLSLAGDTLFEIENHGLNHRPCSIDGESAYGIHGTSTIGDAFDEIEANARKIKAVTGHSPHFYRSATTFMDETCAQMSIELGIKPVSFSIPSGDAVAFTPVLVIEENVLKKIKPGVIIIMHFNHPEWNTCEAMMKIVPELRQMGYSFIRLDSNRFVK